LGDIVLSPVGNVGIGTSSPTEKLDVNGTVKATAFVGDGSGLTDIPGDTDWTESGGNVYRETGNVGIGTDSPGYKLDVNGSVNAQQLYIAGENCDDSFVNEGQANSIISEMITDGEVTSSDVNFNYAGSSSKGGMASNSDKVDGLDIIRFNGQSGFTIVDSTQLKIGIDGSKNVYFENKGVVPGGSNSHYWYSVNNGAPTSAYQPWRTTHNAGGIPWNGRMEFFYILTQTGAGDRQFYWGIIFNDGSDAVNNWFRGFVLAG